MKVLKKSLFLLTFIFIFALMACGNENTSSDGETAGSAANQDLVEIKLGYQKGMPLFSVVKERSDVEERLEAEGFKVSWNEFVSTPAMFEAMIEGGVVFGAGGATGTIFAQQAERPFVRVGLQTGVSGGSSIIVSGDSEIQSVKDLKGKKVAATQGSTQHYLLTKALEKEGLTLEDIDLQFINATEAFPAFGRGDFDAWAVWDPFTAEAEANFDARVIADNTSVFEEEAPLQGGVYYAERAFADENPEAINIILDELALVGAWVNDNEDETAEILANLYNTDSETLKVVESRGGTREVLPIDEKAIEQIQNVADFFFEQGIIEEHLDASDENYNWSSPN